jgi:hypothetical protein
MPPATTCWPRLLTAMLAAKGSVTKSGSTTGPGISLGVEKWQMPTRTLALARLAQMSRAATSSCAPAVV